MPKADRLSARNVGLESLCVSMFLVEGIELALSLSLALLKRRGYPPISGTSILDKLI